MTRVWRKRRSSSPEPASLNTGRRQQKTFCRICEPNCGLIATIEDGHLVSLEPNRDHVLSQGFMCVKGRAMPDVVYDDNRLLYPMRRNGSPGSFERITWDEAISDIAQQLKSIVDTHGPSAYANFVGNPPAFDYAAYLWLNGFQKAIGSPWKYGVNAEDGASRTVASALLYGSPAILMMPDLWHTQLAVIVGANPLVSHGSMVTEPRIRDALRSITGRGGRVIVIDPRRTQTAQQFEHMPIHAGTDAWLFAAISHVLLRDNDCDTEFLQAWSVNVDQLRVVLGPFTPAAASAVCGIAATDIETLAHDIAASPSAVVYGRTGTCAQQFGTLTNFLQDVVNILSGNLDTPGGWLFPSGPIDFAKFAAMSGMDTYGQTRTRASGLPEVLGMLPSRGLAEDIMLEGDGRIRALCTLGANPVLSSGGGPELLEQALEQLELHFSFDLYQNETNKHAHYLLPVRSMYEREDIPFTYLGNMLRPSVFATKAVIEPLGECRQEWVVLNDIARRMGLGGAYAIKPLRVLARLGMSVTPKAMVDVLLRTSANGDWFGLRRNGISFRKILDRHPDGLRIRDELPTGVIGNKLRTADKRLNLAPPEILAELDRLQTTVHGLYAFRLTGMRETKSHNSWMHNSTRLSPEGRTQTLRIHPDDANGLGLQNGDLATVTSPAAAIVVPVELTDEMFPGNVALPHGWGHSGGWQHANSLGGINSNVLAGPYPGSVEALAGMSVLNGIPVNIARTDEIDTETRSSTTSFGSSG